MRPRRTRDSHSISRESAAALAGRPGRRGERTFDGQAGRLVTAAATAAGWTLMTKEAGTGQAVCTAAVGGADWGCDMPDQPTDHAGLETLPFHVCLRLLASVPIGRVGFYADGEVVLLPVNHAVDG